MVEAAIILPLVILSVMAMIYLLINIYSTVSLQSHIHLLLREESGEKSGMVKFQVTDGYKRDKIRRRAESTEIKMASGGIGLIKYLEARKDVTYTTNMLISKAPKKRSYGKSYVLNESNIVRIKASVSKK